MALYYETGNGWVLTTLAKKDLHMDAFLCCPGPSLANINPDILKGKGRMVFAINTAYPKVKPDVWMGMDGIECYDKQLLYEPFMKVFRGTYYNSMYYNGIPVRDYPQTFWASVKEPEEGKTMLDYRQHKDMFVWHKNTMATMIHMMIWMGARNIYLVGCDMGGTKDYYDDRKLDDYKRKYNRRLYTEQVKFIHTLSIQSKKYRIAFYSCTPDSPLNEFLQYIPIEEAIKNSENKCVTDNSQPLHVLDAKDVTVATVYKSGGSYDESYVHRLSDSVHKFLPKAKFVCLSDKEIEGVETVKMKYDWGTSKAPHWCKVELYEHFKTGKTLYIDLSVVVQKDLTPLLSYSGFRMVRDFVNPKYMNSCVMSWTGDHSYITEKFKKDPEYFRVVYNPVPSDKWISGFEQKFTEETAQGVGAFNDGLIVSYKTATKEQIDNSIIVKWHGSPRPHEVGWNIYRPKARWEVLEKLIKENDMKVVAELGTWWGKTFSHLLRTCPNTKIISVDQFKIKEQSDEIGYETYVGWEMEKFKNHALELAGKYNGKAQFMNMSTDEASTKIEDESLDLVFIDAGHSPSEVKKDIDNWFPKVKKGGYVTGHDINWESVKMVVDKEFDGYKVDDDNVWIWQKS